MRRGGERSSSEGSLFPLCAQFYEFKNPKYSVPPNEVFADRFLR